MNSSLTTARAEAILSGIPSQHILVIGDLMLDRFIYGNAERISPEAPVPVVNVVSEICMPGGASNVARNIATLGGQAVACGVVGRDTHAEALCRSLRELGVSCRGIVDSPDVQTTVKTRVIAARQQVVRVDRESHQSLTRKLTDQLCSKIEELISSATGVIIEDYGKGVIQQKVVSTAIRAAAKANIPVGYDPKEEHTLDVHGITFATPNRKEAFHAGGRRDDEPADTPPLSNETLKTLAVDLKEQWGSHFLLVTLGADGMLLVSPDNTLHHVPTRAREVFDVSGAGDTVIATCMLALTAGATPYEAAELANDAAGIVVAKVGTAACSIEELQHFINDRTHE